MKNIIFIILFILPFSSYAKLKDTCNYDGRSYVKDIKINMIFIYQGIIDFEYPTLGGMEINDGVGKPYIVIIHKDDYYLFNAVKNAYLINKSINVCLTKSRLEHSYRHLLGLEMN